MSVKTARDSVLRPSLEKQLNTFFSLQSSRCQDHHVIEESKSEMQKYFSWMKDFAFQYFESRQERANDLESAEIAQSQELAKVFIGENQHDFFATCLDGRNMPTVMFSKPPHVGGVLRAPAGAVTGFMEGQKPGSVFIDVRSFVVKRIVDLLEEKAGETIFYGLDSHVGCAARNLIHSTEGGKQKDQGLRSDIISKIMTAKGIKQLRKMLEDSGKQVADIIPVFFSFDPHIGGVILGLEMHVNEPMVIKEGYTQEVLDKLAAAGKIVRTMDLFGDPEILSVLRDTLPKASADFRNRFSTSMLKNWQVTTEIYKGGEGVVFKKILDILTKAYKVSGWKVESQDDHEQKSISKRTLKQKAKFLLKNLVTRYSIAGTSHAWPYDSHREDLTVITDGGYAPFSKLDAFAVFSRDLNALISNTKLTLDLIRQFRKAGNSSNPVKSIPLTAEEFVSAPILIINKAVFRRALDHEWTQLAKIDFSELFSEIDWNDSDVLSWEKKDLEKVIRTALHGQKIAVNIETALEFGDVIYELFNRFRIMMQDKYFRQMIIYGKIVVINTIVDNNRGPRLIIPFVV